MLAMRLGRSAALAGSARLRCRLLIAGREIGQQTVLLGPPAIDAQGRLAATPVAVPSALAMRVSYFCLIASA